tara:strand:+ start:2745 stop:2930 length:186 start_codon:yes stop_codon:yes gene_type:complete
MRRTRPKIRTGYRYGISGYRAGGRQVAPVVGPQCDIPNACPCGGTNQCLPGCCPSGPGWGY